MNCLLDTHAFLWSAFSSEKLSEMVRTILINNENTVYVSAVSFWEISLKYGIGKIELKNIEPDELPAAAIEMGFELLTIDCEEASSFHGLPRQPHKDPFDRMIIWQAMKNNLSLITKDKKISYYSKLGLKVLW